jgi:hypothetical protein
VGERRKRNGERETKKETKIETKKELQRRRRERTVGREKWRNFEGYDENET